jgi:hypothetical protein
MAQQSIRFRIRPDGRVEELVEGVQGSGCEQLTERIEAKLGTVQQRQSTADAFVAQAVAAEASLAAAEQTLSNPVS